MQLQAGVVGQPLLGEFTHPPHPHPPLIHTHPHQTTATVDRPASQNMPPPWKQVVPVIGVFVVYGAWVLRDR